MKKTAILLISSILFMGTTACSDVSKTSADAPDSVNDKVENPQDVEDTKDDAKNDVRQAQIDADVKAREERNKALGNEQERTEGDLQSEVRAKLEANIPAGKLSVEAEDGVVTIVGTVPDQKEYQTIEPLAKEVKGVKEVKVDVKVVPPAKSK